MNSVKSLFLVTMLLLAPVQARAQNVFVTAGEHDGFTRVFLDAPTGSNWEMEADASSLTVNLTDPVTGFNLTRAYERISNQRIEGFVAVAPTTLRIDLACDCEAEAVDWGQGDVVIDVRNKNMGSTMTASGQALSLPSEPAYDWLSGMVQPPKERLKREWPVQPDIPDEYEISALHRGQPTYKRAATATDTEIGQRLFSGNEAFLNEPPTFPDKALEIPFVTVSGPDEAMSKEFQDVLLNQLQRAVSQGVVDFPQQIVTSINQPNSFVGHQMADAEAGARDIQHIFPDQPSNLRQMLVTNAYEAAASAEAPLRPPSQSEACLPQEWFDPNSWAPNEPSAGLVGLRATLVGEFDKPNPEAVARLASLYLYLGFGLEARQLVETFPVAKERAELIGQIAGLLDQEDVSDYSTVVGQIGCNPDATLWGLLVSPPRILDPDVNLNTVLAAFSGYPIHLRNLIGPALAENLVEFGRNDEAIAVRNLIARSDGADAESINMINAEIEIASGNVETASTMLSDVVAQDSSKAAEALVKLISERKRAGLSVDTTVASAADALAVEYRGTELGRELTEAAIRAFSISGQPQITFARIHDAQKRASISEATIVTLTNEAFEDAARNADDVVFLRLMHSETIPDIRNENPRLFPRDQETRISVADRLIELEFFDKAAAILEPLRPYMTGELQLRFAKIAYGTGHFQNAIALLSGHNDEVAQTIRANATFELGNYATASTMFDEVGAHKQAVNAAWISGDFERAARMDARPASKLVTTSGENLLPIEDLSSLAAPLSTLRGAAERAAELRSAVQQAIN